MVEVDLALVAQKLAPAGGALGRIVVLLIARNARGGDAHWHSPVLGLGMVADTRGDLRLRAPRRLSYRETASGTAISGLRIPAHHLRGRIRPVPISLHHVVTTDHDLADLPRVGQRWARLLDIDCSPLSHQRGYPSVRSQNGVPVMSVCKAPRNGNPKAQGPSR